MGIIYIDHKVCTLTGFHEDFKLALYKSLVGPRISYGFSSCLPKAMISGINWAENRIMEPPATWYMRL